MSLALYFSTTDLIINLIIIGSYQFNGLGGNRIINICNFLPENVAIEYHILGKLNEKTKQKIKGKIFEYHLKIGRVPYFKRISLRKVLSKRINENLVKSNPNNSIILITSPTPFLAPMLKFFKKDFRTILDIRDIYQEWNYFSFIRKKIAKNDQIVGILEG